MARCPAHDDRTASLSIREGNDGKTLIYCHAGCSFERVLAAVTGGNGEGPGTRPIGEVEAVYSYTDAAGALLFQVVRHRGKVFSQRRPNVGRDPGEPEWIPNMRGIRPVLYRLPQILSAVALQRESRYPFPVFLVEGEKDADRLSSMDLEATTSPGGAGKWRPEYGDALRGARVAIIPDNDAPGRKHAEAVASSLRGLVASVKIVTLPDLPEKGDASDWVAAGGTKDALLRLVEQTPEDSPTPGPGPDEDRFAKVAPIETLDLVRIAREGIPPVPWIIPGWLAERDVALIAGGGGIGKSTLVADLALACSTGASWLGIELEKPVRVLFVDEEQGADVVARLFLRLGPPNENLQVASDQGVRLDTDEGAARLERKIAEWKPQIVILDSVQQGFGATEENDATAVGLVFGRIFRLRSTYGVAFGLVHHKKKQQQFKVDMMEMVRGTTGFGTQASTVWFCDPGGPNALNVTQAKRRGATKTSIVAAYAEDGDRIILTGAGPVEDKLGAVAGCSEWVVAYLEDIGGPAKAGQIAEAAKRLESPYTEDVVTKALQHGLKLGVLEKPGAKRGWYGLKPRGALSLVSAQQEMLAESRRNPGGKAAERGGNP